MLHSGRQEGSAIEWSYDDVEKTLKITGSGPMGDVLTVEEYIDAEGKKRTRTVRLCPWDAYADDAELLEIAPSVVSVANAAFFRFTHLKDARMPGVLTIGNGAFYLCYELEIVHMPNVIVIGNGAFERCGKLEKQLIWQEGEKKQGFARRSKFTLKKVLSIGNFAFKDARKLVSVSMEQCVSVGQYAFYECGSLTDASFKSATQIGEGAFYGCMKLANVKLHEGCTLGARALMGTRTDESSIEYIAEEMEE